MEEPQQQQTLLADDEATIVVVEEATLVAPRFDDEETLVARPVVPLANASAPRPTFSPRRSWPLALMLVSVLIGGVLGGAGLYLFQRQSHDGDAAPQAETQPETQPPTAPPAEASNAPQPAAVQPDTPMTPAQPDAQASAPDAAATDATPAREAENVPAAERRDASDDDGAAVAPKRGKKGAHDEELNRQVRREQRPDSEAPPVARANDPAAGERQARRVDSIFYRPRRAARRARRDDDTDRLRRIFEGSPE